VKVGSKRIVVDASIAQSAGLTEYPLSRSCREFLERLLEVCHHVVMTAEIREEWKKHQSDYAVKWRASMVARKKLCVSHPTSDSVMGESIKRAGLSEESEAALRKDAHLVEAALAADLAVASRDEKARDLFRIIAKHWGRIRPIVWVNPAKADDQALAWLSTGAPHEEQRTLGFEG